jgi:hypothetical protein
VKRRTIPAYPEPGAILPAWRQPRWGAGEEIIVISPEASLVGARLDEHHLPETNGRMPVCRRCGSKTDDPNGHQHAPDERQVTRSNQWLDAQLRESRIEHARYLRAR